MSASHVRAFRHTGTFCAMKLMSALVGVALSVNKEIEVSTKKIQCNLKISQIHGKFFCFFRQIIEQLSF